MARYLGIDYGTKRIGISVSDEGGEFAFPREILDMGEEKAVDHIKNLLEKEKIVGVIIGLPTNLSGEDTNITNKVRAFSEKLENIGIEIEFESEILSTKAAKQINNNYKMVDASSASLILQGYLDRKNRI